MERLAYRFDGSSLYLSKQEQGSERAPDDTFE